MKRIIFLLLIILLMFLVACDGDTEINDGFIDNSSTSVDNESAYGEDITDEINKGYFEDEATDLTVTCISGTQNAYSLENGILTFGALSENSVYSISGKLNGSIVIDIGNDYKLDLELWGTSIVSREASPIVILSGSKVTVTAKKNYESFIYDKREAVDSESEEQYSASIYALCDLEIAGKGALTVYSENNNGIHTKDDLEVKNLTLTVYVCDNALKGNDSVTLTSGRVKVIATKGDGIKTTNSGISQKENQRGTVAILGGEHTIYSACDGIDASYNVEINNDAILNIYTNKYSSYSQEVVEAEDGNYYIRFTSDAYKYSVKYYNSEEDYVWVNAQYHSVASGERRSYYYYSFDKMEEYRKFQLFIYSAEMESGQENEYIASSDYLTLNTAYDTFALSSRNGSLSYSWTNYTTKVNDGFGGHGGMGEGNGEKGAYSTKGIKAANEIIINNGRITIKSYDDSLHSGSDTTLENGESPLGNITINNGEVALFSNDDGLHADNTLTINGGKINVTNSYEGAEGAYVNVNGGELSINSRDDGINATASSGTAIKIGGGSIYINCTGDGIDSNSRDSYSGIIFAGGKTVVIANSSMNSAIDSDSGYTYTAGQVVAIMPSGGMSSEAVDCEGFAFVGTNRTTSLTANSYLTIDYDGEEIVTIKIPVSTNARIIYLGSNSVSISTDSSTSVSLDNNGVYWSK